MRRKVDTIANARSGLDIAIGHAPSDSNFLFVVLLEDIDH